MFPNVHPGKKVEKEIYYYIPLDSTTRNCYREWVRKVIASNTLFVAPDEFIQSKLAALVAYNFYRLYPTSSTVIICTENEQSLYLSQFEGVGLPSSDVHILNDDKKLRTNGLTHGVFFVTAKVMTNLLGKNTISQLDMKLLILTDALKAVNNSGISKVVKLGLEVGQIFRVLALCNALPKAVAKAQCMISNLATHTLLLKNANDPQISPILYCKNLKVEMVTFADEREATLLRFALGPRLTELRSVDLINCTDPDVLIYSDIIGWRNIAINNKNFAAKVKTVAILLEAYLNFLLYGPRALYFVLQERGSNDELLQQTFVTDDNLRELHSILEKYKFDPNPTSEKLYELGRHPKFVQVAKILKKVNSSHKVIAFCNTIFGARALAEYLRAAGISVVENYECHKTKNSVSNKHRFEQHTSDTPKTAFLRTQARCLVSTSYIENFGMMQFDVSISVDSLTAGYRFSRFGKTSHAILNTDIENIPLNQRQFDKRADVFKTSYQGYRFRMEESKLTLRRRLSTFPVEYSPRVTGAIYNDNVLDVDPENVSTFSPDLIAMLKETYAATRDLIQHGTNFPTESLNFSSLVESSADIYATTSLATAILEAINGPVPRIIASSADTTNHEGDEESEAGDVADIRDFFHVRAEPIPCLKQQNDPIIRQNKRNHWLRILKATLGQSRDVPIMNDTLLNEIYQLDVSNFRKRSFSDFSDDF